MTSLANIRRAWLAAALTYWKDVIKDEHGSPAIEQMFDRIGWSGFVRSGYRNTGRYAWCGIFQANCGLLIGRHLEDDHCVPVHLDLDVAKFVLPSTARLQSRRKWQAAGVPMPQMYRHSKGDWSDSQIEQAMVPGAVATIVTRDYGDARNDYGGHYVTIEQVNDNGTVSTVEGNAHGELGDGTWGEGVVRRRGQHARKIKDFRVVCHFDRAHFDELGAP